MEELLIKNGFTSTHPSYFKKVLGNVEILFYPSNNEFVICQGDNNVVIKNRENLLLSILAIFE